MGRARDQIAEELLRKYGTVTKGMVADLYGRDVVYTFRNGVSECRAKFAAEGFTIKHKGAKDWRDGSYSLVKCETPVPPGYVNIICKACGGPGFARERDIRAGNGLCCGRRCSARLGKQMAGGASLADMSEASRAV
jgi:hypothetical protein